MPSLRSDTKSDVVAHKYGTNNIILLTLILLIMTVAVNVIVCAQLKLDTAIHLVATNRGIAMHPTISNKLASRQVKNILPVNTNIYSGEEITKILHEDVPFPTNCNDKKCRLKFVPGTLQLSSAETLQQCYVDVNKYRAHIKSSEEPVMTSISHEHKIVYHNIPKSASSTSRYAMFDFLEGKDYALPFDTMMSLVTNHNYTMISFIREPLARFYSSYDEAYFRMGPWMAEGELVRKQPNLRQHYKSIKNKVDKYPYLYEGMKDINDFRRMYCPQDVLDTGVFMDCDNYDSIDDGQLLRRFQQFVNDYDGIEPFDVHLNMQTTNLIHESGKPLPMSALYDAANAEKGWQEVASKVGVTIPDGEMKHGRHQSRRFDVKKVSDATQQKICQILVLDYCCLNFKLPKVCDDIGLYCSLEQMEGHQMWKKDDSLSIAIRPW